MHLPQWLYFHVVTMCILVWLCSCTKCLCVSIFSYVQAHAFCMAFWESRMGLQQLDDSLSGVGIWPLPLVTVVSRTCLVKAIAKRLKEQRLFNRRQIMYFILALVVLESTLLTAHWNTETHYWQQRKVLVCYLEQSWVQYLAHWHVKELGIK